MNHNVREQLDLTVEEYCMLMCIYDYRTQKKLKNLHYTDAVAAEFKSRIQFSVKQQRPVIAALIKKGYYKLKEDRKTLIPDPTSIIPFAPNESKFDLWWELYGKVGNRKEALIMYGRLMKKFDHDYIMERTHKYLVHLQITEYNQLHGASFLNPEKEKFNDQFKTFDKPKANKAGGSFFV